MRSRRRQYRLLISPPIISELAHVLRDYFGWQEQILRGRLKAIVRAAEVIETRTNLKAVPHDPDDDRILECAIDGRADLIVSADRHLRRLGSFRGIPIISPIEFRRILAPIS